MKPSLDFSRVQQLTVDSGQSDQRLDNFLSRLLKRAPKSLIYRIIRRGEVRINGGRAKPTSRLRTGDVIRVPPVRLPSAGPVPISPEWVSKVGTWVVHESPDFLALNKPSGVAVHAGSGLSWGVIDLLRRWRPDEFLELVHRLDRGTSGCLLLARNRESLVRAGAWFAGDAVRKTYVALLDGRLPKPIVTCSEPLSRVAAGDGRREVRVDPAGKPAVSHFAELASSKSHTLASVRIDTGRTHQIRVHAATLGAPVAGDDKYGASGAPKSGRLLLHCYRLDVVEAALGICSPPPEDFCAAVDKRWVASELAGWRELI